jgi:hypothetical protein
VAPRRERKRAESRRTLRARAYLTVTYSRHRHRRFSQRDGLCRSSRFRTRREAHEEPPELSRVWSNELVSWRRGNAQLPAKFETDALVPSSPLGRQPRVFRRQAAQRDRRVSLQASLFTGLTVVEAGLSAMKDIVAELQVSQDELRRDRDE